VGRYSPKGHLLRYKKNATWQDDDRTIDVRVLTAGTANVFSVDYFLVSPSAGGSAGSGVATSRSSLPSILAPSSTTTSRATPVGATVGGVVGGIAIIAILVIALCYFRRRGSHGKRLNLADSLAGEGLYTHQQIYKYADRAFFAELCLKRAEKSRKCAEYAWQNIAELYPRRALRALRVEAR
jgi:hypothetical protein